MNWLTDAFKFLGLKQSVSWTSIENKNVLLSLLNTEMRHKQPFSPLAISTATMPLQFSSMHYSFIFTSYLLQASMVVRHPYTYDSSSNAHASFTATKTKER
ncbi:hypothetical protein RYX36_033354 [Vicia faba]